MMFMLKTQIEIKYFRTLKDIKNILFRRGKKHLSTLSCSTFKDQLAQNQSINLTPIQQKMTYMTQVDPEQFLLI